LLVAVALAASGCGGGSNSSSSTSAGPPPGAPPGAKRFGPGGPPPGPPAGGARPTHGIGALTLSPSELPGFQSNGVSTATSAATFASLEGFPAAAGTTESGRLRRAGFIAGAVEHLSTNNGAEGLSIVEQFGTAARARAEVGSQTKPPSGVKQVSFAVAGIPGALGFENSSPRSDGRNIAFSVGSYYYLVGVGFASGLQNPPTRADLIAAAQRLHKRVHG
jgi:hypothetical protein